MTGRTLVLALGLAVGGGSIASAQDGDEERLKRLEDRVKKQQEEIEALKKEAEKPAPSGDGFRYQSPDGNLDIRVGGRFQEHYRAVVDRPDASRTSPDTFFVRAARIKVDGTVYRDFGFQVEGDFPSSATGPTPTLQAAYLEWRKLKELKVMVGQFKAPMSQERLRSRLFSDFVEDSPLTRFVPGYDIGIQVHGQLAEGLVGYQLAVVNGRSHLDNAGRSRNDDNDEKEFVARVTVSPWASNKDSYYLKGLRLGASGSVTEVDDVPITGAGVTTFDISTPELAVTFLDPATAAGTVNLDGRRTRMGAEFSWAVGPACLRAEYLLRKDEMVNGPLSESVPTKAWSTAVTWIVTGEEKSPETRITPAQNADFDSAWGAVELAVRMSWAEIGDEIEDVGVTLAGQSHEVTTLTFGVNWWLTRTVRISANFVQEDYKDDINFGGGRTEDALSGVLGRFQIDF